MNMSRILLAALSLGLPAASAFAAEHPEHPVQRGNEHPVQRANEHPVPMKRFQHKSFSLSVPSDWTVKRKDKGQTVVFTSPDGPFILVWVEPAAKGTTLAKYVDQARLGFQKDLEGYQEHGAVEDVVLGGSQAKRLLLSQTIAEKPSKTLHHWLLSRGRGVNLACSAEAGRFDATRAAFDQPLATFKLAAPARAR